MIHEAAEVVKQGLLPKTYRWQPYPDRGAGIPHPQRLALESEADILGYGGEAGAGKTDLLLGIAERHHRSIIFRETFPALRDIIDRSREIFSSPDETRAIDSFNESLHVWRLSGDRVVEFASMQKESDKEKYKGRPKDFHGFDELTDFSESQFRFVTAWNRSTYIDPFTGKLQRCRVVVGFNPPMNESGDWVTRYFLPWLAYLHPDIFSYDKPAKPGEIRWFINDGDKDVEVDQEQLSWYTDHSGTISECENGEPFTSEQSGEVVIPLRGTRHNNQVRFARSRTFIPAHLSDNPKLISSGYSATIDALPEPLRSLLKGKFNAGRVESPWKVIPRAWVNAAVERWKARDKPPEDRLTSVGVDVARGGKAQTVLARFYDNYIDWLDKYPGASTPDGPSVAALVEPYAHASMGIYIDIIGVGSSAYDSLIGMEISAIGINFAVSPPAYVRSRNGLLKFRNIRAAAYWLFREALDPVHGDNIALPDDSELIQELCEPTWKPTANGILIEDKDDIADRLHRSPDSADAVVMGYYGIAASGTPGV